MPLADDKDPLTGALIGDTLYVGSELGSMFMINVLTYETVHVQMSNSHFFSFSVAFGDSLLCSTTSGDLMRIEGKDLIAEGKLKYRVWSVAQLA